jgi:hypothetical protein
MSDRIFEEGVDETIDRALARLSAEEKTPMRLASAIPFFRSDGVLFVTVIAEPATLQGQSSQDGTR